MKLMTNNPAEYIGLKGYGLAIAGKVPLSTPVTRENTGNLETERVILEQCNGLDFNGLENKILRERNGQLRP